MRAEPSRVSRTCGSDLPPRQTRGSLPVWVPGSLEGNDFCCLPNGGAGGPPLSGYENREVRVSRLNLGPCLNVQHPCSTLPPDGSSVCGDTFITCF